MLGDLKDTKRYCIACKEVHIHTVLDDEDYYEILFECWHCGSIYSITEAVREALGLAPL